MKNSNQKSNTDQVYFRTSAHYHKQLPSGNIATIYVGDTVNINDAFEDTSFLGGLAPLSKDEFNGLLNRSIKKILGEPDADGMTYEAVTPTEFEVKLVSSGVTVTFNASCPDPNGGTGNTFDIDIHSVETHTGEDILPFLKALELDEFLVYELMDYASDIYVNIDDVEEDEYRHHLEIMEMNRQSYTW